MLVKLLKIGGSLAKDREGLKKLVNVLSMRAKNSNLLIVPGGSVFADLVRDIDSKFDLPNITSHKMALLAMDQFGLLLESLARAKTFSSLDKALNACIKKKFLTIYLPSQELILDKTIPTSWEFTSDSISALIAKRIEADQLILLKDVDGIFTTDPKKNKGAKLIPKLNSKELEGINSCLDPYFPKMLRKFEKECWIINGFRISRVLNALDDKAKEGIDGTLLVP
jgi:hypothetical protein